MTNYRFDGHWEFEQQLPSFRDFTSSFKKGLEKGVEIKHFPLKIRIVDHRGKNPDPLPEQIAAIEFLISHQEEIVDVFTKGLYAQYLDFRDIERRKKSGEYEAENEDDDDEEYEEDEFEVPHIKGAEEISTLVTVHAIDIYPQHREGRAYVGFVASYYWDEIESEFAMHGTRMINAMKVDDDFNIHSIGDDLGTHVESSIERWKREENEDPVFHTPDPKYGALRKWQEEDNQFYFHKLISRKMNARFIAEYESGDEKFSAFRPWPNSALAIACQANNEELAYYILKHHNPDPNITIGMSVFHFNKPLAQALLDRGSSPAYSQGVQKVFERMEKLESENAAEELWQKAFEMLEWVYSIGVRPISCTFRSGAHRPENDFLVLSYMSEKNIHRISTFMNELAVKYPSPGIIEKENVEDAKTFLHHYKMDVLHECIRPTKNPFLLWSWPIRKAITSYIIATGVLPSPDFFPFTTDPNNAVQLFVTDCIKKRNPNLAKSITDDQGKPTLSEEFIHREDFGEKEAESPIGESPNFFTRFLRRLRG